MRKINVGIYKKDFSYASTRLEGSFCLDENKDLVQIMSVQSDGNFRVLKVRRSHVDDSKVLSVPFESLDIGTSPLGYVSVNSNAHYLAVIPNRACWKQGFRPSGYERANVFVVDPSQNGGRITASPASQYPSFWYQAIKKNYLSKRRVLDLLETGFVSCDYSGFIRVSPISNDFALTKTGRLLYKTLSVGTWNKENGNLVLTSDRFKFLTKQIGELNERV